MAPLGTPGAGPPKKGIPMLRKLLTTMAAAILTVLAFAPTAQAAVTTIAVGSSTTGNHTVTLANKGSISVTMGSITAGCTSASGSGYVKAGSPPASSSYLVITSTTFTGCTGPLGIPVTLSQVCDLVVSYDGSPTVAAALTDVVDGTLAVNNCLQVTGTGCSMTVGNSVDADFNETVKATSPSKQDLVISGTGLTAQNVSGCFGLVSNGASISFNLTFNVTSANGSVNFS